MTGQARQAPGIVKARLLGAPADIEALAAIFAGHRNDGLDVPRRSAPHPNRHDGDQRACLTLRITQPKRDQR